MSDTGNTTEIGVCLNKLSVVEDVIANLRNSLDELGIIRSSSLYKNTTLNEDKLSNITGHLSLCHEELSTFKYDSYMLLIEPLKELVKVDKGAAPIIEIIKPSKNLCSITGSKVNNYKALVLFAGGMWIEYDQKWMINRDDVDKFIHLLKYIGFEENIDFAVKDVQIKLV